jgi:exosortase J
MPGDTQPFAPQASESVRLQVTSSSGISTFSRGDELVEPQRTGSLACTADRLAHLPAGFYAGVAVVLVAVGSLSLSPLWRAMFHLWATDPLRSIGAVFPLVACVGVLAAWRRLGWRMNGTAWSLPLVALSILLARSLSVFVVEYDGLRLINFGTALFLYASGAVLLFGGPRLLRASIAPLCLLLLINPVPSAFNSVVDLPLQYLSASTARAFARLIGLQPTGVQLGMMFAPDFGMFIAPGCNGVRGSITLGYLALIFGYVRRLRPRMLVLTSLGALLLGYAFNLLRLSVLVVYYRLGMRFPSIQKHGAGVDYTIGCTLFLFAAMGLGLIICSLEPSTAAGMRRLMPRPTAEMPGLLLQARYTGYAAALRALCFLALTLVSIVPEVRSAAWLHASQHTPQPNEQEVLGSFPASVGPYRLTRTWAEHGSNGVIALAMAEYSTSPDTGDKASRITFGLWVGSAHHLVADSKFIQGILAQWTGSFDASARQALPVRFVTSFYDDGISRQYDAEATCSEAGCSGSRRTAIHQGFFFAAPGLAHLAFTPLGNTLPILLRREWPDSDPAPSADLRAQFEADVRIFMEQIDLRPLMAQDGSQF